jgi:predicted PolB exonuclease-like 3'-5' exonuclease
MEFAIFDIETRIDKQLMNQVFFAHDTISDEEAYLRFREELGNRGSDFFPLTLHVPVSIAIGSVTADYVLQDVQTLGMEAHSEEGLVREFWKRLEHFCGCLVSFNGRRFDLPVLELAALRWGVPARRYFNDGDSPRSRGALERHLDLYEYLTNSGEVGLRGGMDLLVKMIGLPGKFLMNGAMVQEYYESGRLAEIHRYCRTDVIQTYFLFLRVELMRGRIDPARYHAAWSTALPLLEELRAGAGRPGVG